MTTTTTTRTRKRRTRTTITTASIRTGTDKNNKNFIFIPPIPVWSGAKTERYTERQIYRSTAIQRHRYKDRQ